MAPPYFSIATQILIDGPRNTVAQVTGDGLSSSLPITSTILLNPATLTVMNPGMSGAQTATLLRLDQIDYSISDNTTVALYWDATTPVPIAELYGRGKIEMKNIGGFQNYAGAGVTGKIGMDVYASDISSAVGEFSMLLVLRTVKYRPISVGGA
jgi:hypothetical protein